MQLAIDTSTDIASLALVQNQEIIAEMTWRCGQNHTVELYPRLDFLVQKSGQDIRTADCVYVAKGPGSFNGLRVGVSAAKGIAFSLGIPIIAVGTLEICAYAHAASGLPVCVIQNAGREEIAAAFYRQKRTGWSELKAEYLTTTRDLMSKIKGKTIFCGDFNPETGVLITKLGKTLAIVPSQAARLRRAGFLIELAKKRFDGGYFDDVATLQPVYLRKPPISERKKP